MILITGRPRTGKTQVAKNIYTQLKHRHILTFDYSGEHALSAYPNIYSKSANWGNHLANMVQLHDFGYPLSEYGKRNDWLSLGMPTVAADITAFIARRKDVHQDDFFIFKKILEDVPYGQGYIYPFNQKYHLNLRAPLHMESWKSMQRVISTMENIFGSDSSYYNLLSIFNKHKHININLQLSKGNVFAQKVKARLLVGKVLEKMVPYLTVFKPVLIFEEADLLIPQMKEDEFFSSADWIKQYVLKIGRRAGCMLIFIVQDETRCDSVISNEYDWKVSYQGTSWGDDRGVFLWASKDAERSEFASKMLFRPLDPSSQFEHYPQIHQQ